MSKPKLVFVGHSYHQKTRSTVFLRELLAREFSVTELWDESWRPGMAPPSADAINRLQPQHIVFFQLLASRAALRRIRCRNITWVPMHDNIDYAARHWTRLHGAGIKVLSFSGATQRFFGSLGFHGLKTQYFPEPAPDSERVGLDEPEVFFWVRKRETDWSTLKALLGDVRPRRIVMRFAPDPGEQPALPDADDVHRYNIDIHNGWLAPDQYRRLLKGCNLFMAPRRLEGIGMAALEAMAAGIVVIAADRPTMNEYVRHGVTGYLYDPDRPAPLRLRHLEEMAQLLRQELSAGRRCWLQDQDRILDFVRAPCATRQSPQWMLRRLIRR